MSLVHEEFLALWPAEAPGALGNEPEDIPGLQIFLPDDGAATGAACIICPGGGYRRLADHEGIRVGKWLAAHGITAFVLRYRLGPRYTHPTQLGDGLRAIRFVRAHAEEWQLDPERIAILGFSAGGHLVSTTATRFDNGDPQASDPIERVPSRPNAQILVYPVISFETTYNPVRALLGDDPDPAPALLAELSSEQHVRPDTPPAFLVQSTSFLLTLSQALTPNTTQIDSASELDRLAAPLVEVGRLLPHIQRLLAD